MDRGPSISRDHCARNVQPRTVRRRLHLEIEAVAVAVAPRLGKTCDAFNGEIIFVAASP